MRTVKVRKNRTAWKILRRDFFEPGTYSENTVSAAFKLIEARIRRSYRHSALSAKKRGNILDYKYLCHTAESFHLVDDIFGGGAYDSWGARHPKRAEQAQKIRDRMWAEEEVIARSIDLAKMVEYHGERS